MKQKICHAYAVAALSLLVGWSVVALAQNEDATPPPPEMPPQDFPTDDVPAELPPEPALPEPNNTQQNEPVDQDANQTQGTVPDDADDDKLGAASVPAGKELVQIDFPELTEIKDIAKAVFSWTGKNVIMDRNVAGKVQIISPQKVTKEEAYQAFLSALNILGFTTVETGKVIKIMPIQTAVKGNLKTIMGTSWTPASDEVITQIVPLKYIDAREIQTTLSRLTSSNAIIAYQPTNTLIISDSGFKVRRILDIIDLLDVQGQQAQVSIVPIRYADAKSIADKVQEIFRGTGSGTSKTAASSRGGSGYGSYKIFTDERTNSVVIFGPPRTISDVKSLVKKFDVRVDDPSRQASIHVRPLDYANATKLAATLQALASGGNNRNTVRRPPVVRRNGRNQQNQPPAVAELDDNVKITADESSNSLLITGSHSAYRAINSIIRKLDIRRSQVFVESDILDINMEGGFKFETSIFGGGGDQDSSAIATTWKAKPLAPLIASQATGSTDLSDTQIKEAAGVFATDDLTVGILSGKSINIAGLGSFRPGALIKLLKTDANTRVISSPHILTSNNEEARIVVGEKMFFTTTDTNPTTGIQTSKIDRENVNMTLTIKPNISHANYVTLDMNLESDSFAGLDPQTNSPKISQRQTKQIVTVKNGQTVVISGLVRTHETESFSKIPLLGDIPILGWLFRNSSMSKVQQNLMIFLTPHIVHGADDLAAVYQQKLEERDSIMESIYGASFDKNDFYALLPKPADGAYRPDEIDKQEKARRQEMLDEMYKSSSDTTPGGMNPRNNNSESSDPIAVPLGPSENGANGGDLPIGGDFGGDVPPPAMDQMPMDPMDPPPMPELPEPMDMPPPDMPPPDMPPEIPFEE